MQTRKKKMSKSERIPKLGSPARVIMLEILTGLQDYKDAMSRGLRFFTEENLNNIESKYSNGMTWDDIESVMSNQGTLLKHGTFRKYILDAIIPKATNHKATEDGRVALYEANIIRHLNFVNFFYNVTDAPMIDVLMKTIGDYEISYEEAIESILGGSLYVALVRGVAIAMEYEAAADAIDKALAKRDDKPNVLEMYNDIKTKYEKYIAKDFGALIDYLRTKKMLVTQIPE